MTVNSPKITDDLQSLSMDMNMPLEVVYITDPGRFERICQFAQLVGSFDDDIIDPVLDAHKLIRDVLRRLIPCEDGNKLDNNHKNHHGRFLLRGRRAIQRRVHFPWRRLRSH